MYGNSERIYDELISNMNDRKAKNPDDEIRGLVQMFQQTTALATLNSQVEELKEELSNILNQKKKMKKLAESDRPFDLLKSMFSHKLLKIIDNLERTYEKMGYHDVDLLGDLEIQLNQRIKDEKARWAEGEKRAKSKAHLYRHYEYSEEEIVGLLARLQLEGEAFGRMPQSHEDVPEIRGWMLPYLFAYDSLFTGRWDYWRDIIAKGTIEGSGPIPQIEWESDKGKINQVSKMLQDCLNLVIPYGSTISEFADWLLWGLGMADKPARIPDTVNEHWYKTFDLALVLKYPTDYMSGLLEEATTHGFKSAVGYFATPLDVTNLMHELTFSDRNPESVKTEAIYEPAVGCGAMLLPASNHTLFAAAQDINPVAVKLCLVQMMWYAPWYAKNPFNKDTLELDEKVKEQMIEIERNLEGLL